MTKIIEPIKLRGNGSDPLRLRPKSLLAQSVTCTTVLRRARLVAIKEQIRKGAYQVAGKKVADALIRETLLDSMLTRHAGVLSIDDVPAHMPTPVASGEDRLRFFSRITVERIERPLQTLWQVIGWGQNGERYTLAVCLKESIANAMHFGLLKRCPQELPASRKSQSGVAIVTGRR
jgi:anti-sigma-28 factor FlgM